MAEWRVGGKLKRTLYRDEQLVGLVDTAEIAGEIVETMNRVGRLIDEVRQQTGGERSLLCAACGRTIPLDGGGRFMPHYADAARIAWCTSSRAQVGEPLSRDAQRRSEATPQKDLPKPLADSPFEEPQGGRCPDCNDPWLWHRNGRCAGDFLCCTCTRQPPDAERRSEATPQKDLPRDHIAGVTGCDCTMCRALDASRVDPYDTTKGFTS